MKKQYNFGGGFNVTNSQGQYTGNYLPQLNLNPQITFGDYATDSLKFLGNTVPIIRGFVPDNYETRVGQKVLNPVGNVVGEIGTQVGSFALNTIAPGTGQLFSGLDSATSNFSQLYSQLSDHQFAEGGIVQEEVEAEGGETIYHRGRIKKIVGNKHKKNKKNSGVKMYAEDGGYIFSDQLKPKNLSKIPTIPTPTIPGLAYQEIDPELYYEAIDQNEQSLNKDFEIKKNHTIADVSKMIDKKYPISKNDDLFSQRTNQENASSAFPYFAQLMLSNEMANKNMSTDIFKMGGKVKKKKYPHGGPHLNPNENIFEPLANFPNSNGLTFEQMFALEREKRINQGLPGDGGIFEWNGKSFTTDYAPQPTAQQSLQPITQPNRPQITPTNLLPSIQAGNISNLNTPQLPLLNNNVQPTQANSTLYNITNGVNQALPFINGLQDLASNAIIRNRTIATQNQVTNPYSNFIPQETDLGSRELLYNTALAPIRTIKDSVGPQTLSSAYSNAVTGLNETLYNQNVQELQLRNQNNQLLNENNINLTNFENQRLANITGTRNEFTKNISEKVTENLNNLNKSKADQKGFEQTQKLQKQSFEQQLNLLKQLQSIYQGFNTFTPFNTNAFSIPQSGLNFNNINP